MPDNQTSKPLTGGLELLDHWTFKGRRVRIKSLWIGQRSFTDDKPYTPMVEFTDVETCEHRSVPRREFRKHARFGWPNRSLTEPRKP